MELWMKKQLDENDERLLRDLEANTSYQSFPRPSKFKRVDINGKPKPWTFAQISLQKILDEQNSTPPSPFTDSPGTAPDQTGVSMSLSSNSRMVAGFRKKPLEGEEEGTLGNSVRTAFVTARSRWLAGGWGGLSSTMSRSSPFSFPSDTATMHSTLPSTIASQRETGQLLPRHQPQSPARQYIRVQIMQNQDQLSPISSFDQLLDGSNIFPEETSDCFPPNNESESPGENQTSSEINPHYRQRRARLSTYLVLGLLGVGGIYLWLTPVLVSAVPNLKRSYGEHHHPHHQGHHKVVETAATGKGGWGAMSALRAW